MSIDEIRDGFKSANVLFATNGDDEPNSPMPLSIATYRDVVTEGDFIVLESRHGRWCGKNAFIEIMEYAYRHGYDYLLYIDADCFITRCDNLFSLFSMFRNSGCVLGGPPDGGMFCHRNCNRFSINPFLMFVDIRRIASGFRNGGRFSFNDNRLNPPDAASVLGKIGMRTRTNNASVIDAYSRLRGADSGYRVPHAEVISRPHNDHEIYYGSGQHPWTSSNSVNFEGYYDIFLSVYNGDNDVFFTFGRDYPCKADPSGITSAIYCDSDITDDGKLVCLHTWFTRLANPGLYGEFGRYHLDRINAVYGMSVDMRGGHGGQTDQSTTSNEYR